MVATKLCKHWNHAIDVIESLLPEYNMTCGVSGLENDAESLTRAKSRDLIRPQIN